MGVTVAANKRTVVHKGSGGTSIAFPDVCLTTCGSSVVPIPYPNTAQSADLGDGAQTVKADGNPLGHEKSIFTKSMGDDGGDQKGVASGTIQDKAEFISFSFDVQVEGKGVVRAMDQMIHNNKNTPPTPLIQPPLVVALMDETPVIPEQGKMEMQFIDPFGEPLEGLEVEVEVDGKKEVMTTMSRGQIFHIADSDSADISVKNENLNLIEKK